MVSIACVSTWEVVTVRECFGVVVVLRDMNRGRDLEQILSQYTTFVKPAFEEFCLPVSMTIAAHSKSTPPPTHTRNSFSSSRLRNMQTSLFRGVSTTWVSQISAVVFSGGFVCSVNTPSSPSSGHKPHRAAHPGHSERGHLQMAARVPHQPGAELETGHNGALRSAERDYDLREEGPAGAQQPAPLRLRTRPADAQFGMLLLLCSEHSAAAVSVGRSLLPALFVHLPVFQDPVCLSVLYCDLGGGKEDFLKKV